MKLRSVLSLGYHHLVPRKIGDIVSLCKQMLKADRQRKKLSNSIVGYYRTHTDCITDEVLVVLSYLKKHRLQLLPYAFVNAYEPEAVMIGYDSSRGLRYAIYNGKKLYVKRSWTEHKIREYVCSMLAAQDHKSPCRYLSQNFCVSEGDRVADVGAAAGIFSLSIIELAKQVLIFECNPDWLEPLEATFHPWKHKVQIVGKRVGRTSQMDTISLDTYCSDHNIVLDFLKINAEGSEKDVLKGVSRALNKKLIQKLVLCTFYGNQDYQRFHSYFTDLGYTAEGSPGFVINWFDADIKPPFLRRGIIRASLPDPTPD